MKKLAIALLFVLAAVSVTSAHPGRTDSMGCHTESQTGIRHCH